MRSTICTLALVALIGGGHGLMAQSSPQPQPKPQPPAQEEAKLIGCLKPAAAVPGAASTASADGQFVLLVMPPHAGMPSENRGAEATGMSPRDAARAATTESPTYRLVAKKDVELAKHVNHTVELTGAKVRAEETENAAARATAKDGDLPILNVTELRMVAATCETKK